MPRGIKRVIDIERQVDEISELTDNELRAMAADTTARVESLRQRWEATGDLHALIGALIFFQLRLPEWLFSGLMRKLNEQFKNPHATRYLAVRHAHDAPGMSMDESYDWASQHITDQAAKGGRDTMMRSYQRIRAQVAKIDRIQPRSRARRRRG